MKDTLSEPPGRLHQVSKPSVLPLRKPNPKHASYTARQNSHIWRSVDEMVATLRPEEPVYALRPATIAATAKWFIKQFPGDVLYAVKTNPDPLALASLARAGVKHYDVASLAEVKLVAEHVPAAEMYFMHPVKSREAIAVAFYDYGVRSFSLDTHEELEKILDVTGNAQDLNLYVRLSIPNNHAAMSLGGKFGVSVDQAESLLAATREASAKLGVCFHVGSQCMNPEAYGVAMGIVSGLLARTGIKLDVLDIGGGFPSVYPGMTPPPLGSYMRAIKKALKAEPLFEGCKIVCEPGRALVAEGGSSIVRVELRKGNSLYINDGVYGSLFDAGMPGFVYPVRVIRPNGKCSDEVEEFSFYGPTCDSYDAMKGPFHLPKDIKEGDWIEIGQLGAYGSTMRTNFNGFQSNTTVEVADQPMLSMFGIN